MTQRNPMNERYQQEDERLGQTRKSAASAKPVSKAASSTHEPAPKTKKQKRQEERERARREEAKAVKLGKDASNITSVKYQQYRKQWWIALIAGVVCTALSWYVSTTEQFAQHSATFLIAAYALIIYALYLDLGKMRKLRRGEDSSVMKGNSKEARRQQKAEAQRRRELEKRAAEVREEEKDQPKASFADKVKGVFSSKKE